MKKEEGMLSRFLKNNLAGLRLRIFLSMLFFLSSSNLTTASREVCPLSDFFFFFKCTVASCTWQILSLTRVFPDLLCLT